MSVSSIAGANVARPLARLLSVDAALFALVFVLVPNVPFIAMWFFITPRRLFAVPFYLIAGLIAVRVPLWAGAILFALVAAFDVLLVISGIFDLSPLLVLDAIRFAPLLDVGGSKLYAGLGAIIAASVAAMVWLTRTYRTRLAEASPVLALFCMLAWIGVEARVNVPVSKMFGQHMTSLVKFDSALRKSGLASAHPAPAKRNLLIVMVEGMGAYSEARHTQMLEALINTDQVRARYEVSWGAAPYLGSTTGAAARELCGEWGDYRAYRDGPAKACLPGRLSRAGYDTIAVHGFTQKFFDRDIWYPKIGFSRSLFAEQLIAAPMKDVRTRCGLTFKGFCDADVGEVVRSLLTSTRERPRFVYWLTLNTHMPFNPSEATPRFGCETNGGPFGDKTVCYLTQMWGDIFSQIASIATDPALPPTDIMIVGDHHTPLFTRTARSLFAPGQVAWFALKAKAPGEGL